MKERNGEKKTIKGGKKQSGRERKRKKNKQGSLEEEEEPEGRVMGGSRVQGEQVWLGWVWHSVN